MLSGPFLPLPRWRWSGAVVLLGALAAVDAAAHGGGLNKQGCHTTRATGDYHCHHGGAPAAAQRARPPAPVRNAFNAPAPATRPFANCTEARAAGAAPVRRGEPGYGPHLDRDNDGIGCEPYRGRR